MCARTSPVLSTSPPDGGRALEAWACRYVPVDWVKNSNYSTGLVLEGLENIDELTSDWYEVSTKVATTNRKERGEPGNAVDFIVGAETQEGPHTDTAHRDNSIATR